MCRELHAGAMAHGPEVVLYRRQHQLVKCVHGFVVAHVCLVAAPA